MPRKSPNKHRIATWRKKLHLHLHHADRCHLLRNLRVLVLRIHPLPFLRYNQMTLLTLPHPLPHLSGRYPRLQFQTVKVQILFPANDHTELTTFVAVDDDSEVLEHDEIAEEIPSPTPPRRSMPPPPRRQSTDTSTDNASIRSPTSPPRKPSGARAIPPPTLPSSPLRTEKASSPEQSTLSPIHHTDSEILDEEEGGKSCQFL